MIELTAGSHSMHRVGAWCTWVISECSECNAPTTYNVELKLLIDRGL